MQALGAITPAQLRAAGQEPLMKVEIYVGGAWTDLNSLSVGKVVEGADVSLGGASMTPNPVEGTWGASLLNEDSVFHPHHPTSPYTGYLRTERLTRISIGAEYGGVGYYWQRVIGYMDEPTFSSPDYRVTLSGGDYMKRLRETELRTPTNYWGSSQLYNSIASDGVIGAEIYVETDAMDTTDDGTAPYDNVANWVATNCAFASVVEAGSPSTFFVGVMTGQGPRPVSITNVNVGVAVAGTKYQVRFYHRIVGGTGVIPIRCRIDQASGLCGFMMVHPTDAWKEEVFEFVALDNGPIEWTFKHPPTASDFRLDLFSIKTFVSYWDRYYQLPGGSTGAYFVELDGNSIWQGEGDEGWWEEEATSRVFFDINKVVANGVNNLRIYYFEQQEAEDIVASLLYLAKAIDPATGIPYVNEAAALATLIAVPEYVDPNVQIDRVWFTPGSSCLNAIKKICERCNYRFYFKYDGTPVFRPAPAVGAVDFTFTDPKQIESTSGPYQARNEIKNRIVIKGMKGAEPVSELNTMPSNYEGEDADDGVGDSIDTYGERTLTINNHLFQSDAECAAMCTTLLAERKDPRWYSDITIPFTALPMELYDTLQWEERLSPILNITQTGLIRDIKIDNFGVMYKCELA